MFDYVLSRRGTLPEHHYGSGVVIAAFVYSGLVAFGAWAQQNVRVADRQDVLVSFVMPPRLAPPAPPRPAAIPASLPAAPRGPKLKVAVMSDRPRTVLVQAIVAPTEIPQARPPEQEPSAASALEGGEDAAADYEVPGVPGGIVDPVVDASVVATAGTPAARPPEFESSRMMHPEFISGPSPKYTEKALEREVEGTMEVRCIVTVEGRVRDCRVVKSLPFMDRAVIDALERRRYRPATLGGRPVEVYYRFRIPLKLEE